MSKYFYKFVPKSVPLRPITIAKTANVVERTFGKELQKNSQEKKNKGNKTKEDRLENKGPIRKFKLEQSKLLKLESSAKNLYKKTIQNNDKSKESVLQKPSNSKSYKFMNALKEKKYNKIKTLNEIEKSVNDMKSPYLKKNQSKFKAHRIFSCTQRQKERSKALNVTAAPMKPLSLQIKPTTSVTEPPRNQQMKNVSISTNWTSSFVTDNLMPVDKKFRNSFAMDNGRDNKDEDPLYLWKYPTLANKVNFDISDTMKRIQIESQTFNIGQKRLLEKHTPWERNSTTVDHVDNGDYSTKCAKRYNAISVAKKIESAIKPDELLIIPQKVGGKKNLSVPRDAKQWNDTQKFTDGMNTTRSSVSSLRSSVNKKIYRNFPNFRRMKKSHSASYRLDNVTALQSKKH